MAKKKAAEPTVETPAEEAAPVEKITQRVAVEKALAAGKELPVDGVPYVQEKFGITLSNQAFSTIKSKINTAGKTKAKKPGRPAASVNGSASHEIVKATPSTTSPADLAQAVKALVKQHGVDAIKKMADVFAD